jgi:hypothetical protein
MPYFLIWFLFRFWLSKDIRLTECNMACRKSSAFSLEDQKITKFQNLWTWSWRSLIQNKEQVLRFQISMHYFHGVAVKNRWQDLLQDQGGISLAIVWPLDDLIEQFTSATMLRQDEVSFWILIDLEESHIIRVIHSFEDFNFLQDSGLLYTLEKTILAFMKSSSIAIP